MQAYDWFGHDDVHCTHFASNEAAAVASKRRSKPWVWESPEDREKRRAQALGAIEERVLHSPRKGRRGWRKRHQAACKAMRTFL